MRKLEKGSGSMKNTQLRKNESLNFVIINNIDLNYLGGYNDYNI